MDRMVEIRQLADVRLMPFDWVTIARRPRARAGFQMEYSLAAGQSAGHAIILEWIPAIESARRAGFSRPPWKSK